jgi:hypothetical protein
MRSGPRPSTKNDQVHGIEERTRAMYRSTLTLRRFGPMSFGLGYYENGIWVDHSTSDGTTLPRSAKGTASQPGDLALDAVHQWYGCCANSTAAQSSVITDETEMRASSMARTERPSASVIALMPLAPVRAVEK